MIALILNSGMGSRMGDVTKSQPKCMTNLSDNETILSRQLDLIQKAGISKVVITTGKFDQMIRDHVFTVAPDLEYVFVVNPLYDKTNYIYSIYLAKQYLDDDLILIHGDLVFEDGILQDMMAGERSYMAVCETQSLPEKDFKAVFKWPLAERRKDNLILKVGIDCFDNACAAQPLYCLRRKDWGIWLNEIRRFCDEGQVNCYAENAFNEVSDKCLIYAYETGEKVCGEVDTPDDLHMMRERLKR